MFQDIQITANAVEEDRLLPNLRNSHDPVFSEYCDLFLRRGVKAVEKILGNFQRCRAPVVKEVFFLRASTRRTVYVFFTDVSGQSYFWKVSRLRFPDIRFCRIYIVLIGLKEGVSLQKTL